VGLFAVLTGQDWVLIIGAVSLAVERVYSIITESRRNAAAVERDAATAAKVEEVKATASRVSDETTKKLDHVATKVEEVRTETAATITKQDDKLDSIAKVGEEAAETGKKVHLLVNSQLGKVLASNAALARWKADQTKNRDDEMLATDAERDSSEHTAKQKLVDERDKP
jgi:predicted transcriptional regulator